MAFRVSFGVERRPREPNTDQSFTLVMQNLISYAFKGFNYLTTNF